MQGNMSFISEASISCRESNIRWVTGALSEFPVETVNASARAIGRGPLLIGKYLNANKQSSPVVTFLFPRNMQKQI